MQRIAVAIVHGVEIDDPNFATTPTRLLKKGFAEAMGRDGPDPDDALVIEPVFWAPHLESRQRGLFARMYPEQGEAAFDDELSGVVRRVNAGSVSSLVPLLVSLLRPTLPSMSTLHYPTLRWIMVHFVGDVIAYDRAASPANYATAHQALARGLAALARKAGDDAPLCVIAHSFGSVLVSDYVYDQQESARTGRDLVLPEVQAVMGNSPLARGETLAWLFTMGSPLALWSLRYADGDMAKPIDVPGTGLADRHPDLGGEWVNLYEKDDVMAYPLRPLGPAYQQVVTEDREISLLGFPVSATPLVHPFYWSDRAVMDGIARGLAEGWRVLNP